MMQDFQRTLSVEDEWHSQSSSLHYLRITLMRVRAGMSDFLMKVSIASEKPVVITLRVAKGDCNSEGYSKLAGKITKNFEAKGEKTLDWKTVNIENIASMISSELKFFSQNASSENLRFVTEALK